MRVGLRARATIGFGVTGLLVALVLAAITYSLARSYLVDQRQTAAEQQTYVNARLARTVLRTPDPDIRDLLGSLGGGTASDSVLRYRGEWFSTSVTFGSDAIPEDLVRIVSDGHAGHQRYRAADGTLRLAVGVPIAAADGAYFELFALDELDRTLDLLTRALAFGVAGGALVAAAVGRAAAGRLVRPLAPVADAAEKIADGALDTRLTGIDDPDLRRLADAFNTMAISLEALIEREARFAAVVDSSLDPPVDLSDVVNALAEPPDAGSLRTAVGDPPLVRNLRVIAGMARVDLLPAVTTLGGDEQLLAVAQLVCTLTARPGVGQVSFTLEGAPIDVPAGDGSLTSGPVSRDDYADLLA